MAVLCLAGSGTSKSVQAVAHSRGFNVTRVRTVAEAIGLLEVQPWDLLVSALGTSPGKDVILDKNGRSMLLDAAKAFGLPRVIFSHTACSDMRTSAACRVAGAQAVVNSKETLQAALDALAVPSPPPPAGEATVAAVVRSALGGGGLRVPARPPMERFLYLPPGAETLEPCGASSLPPPVRGCSRLVCIADTHNEHESLRLPPGDVLIHAGDCLTESGTRYVERRHDLSIARVSPEGIELFRRFAVWFGAQPHRHKVLIGGNHDLVLQGLGKERVREILASSCAAADEVPVYLEHSAAIVGGLQIFGSPFAHYAGKNDAFLQRDVNFSVVPPRCDVIVTHMPCILPRGGGFFDEDAALAAAIHRAGAAVHVSGHCHWAHGLYHTRERRVPCVVASVSDSDWQGPLGLTAASGTRGDARDASRGGYNVELAPIVCDIKVQPLHPQETTHHSM